MTKVVVRQRKGRGLELYWQDPDTGKPRSRKCKAQDPRKAEREAAKLEAKINDGEYGQPVAMDAFLERCREEMYKFKSGNYTALIDLSLRKLLEHVGGSKDVNKIRSHHITGFREALSSQCSESTVRTYLRHIKAAMEWGKKTGIVYHIPELKIGESKRKVTIRKKTIGDIPYIDLIKAAREVRPEAYAKWAWFIEGLWLSGLRLSEGLLLSWHEGPFQIDDSGKFPMYRILGEGQKSGIDELSPLTPDFYKWLGHERPLRSAFGIAATRNYASNVIADILTELVGERRTAHDLRRSFGSRWAVKVKPAVLMKLMRHKNIETTMKYYISLDAQDIAETLWQS